MLGGALKIGRFVGFLPCDKCKLSHDVFAEICDSDCENVSYGGRDEGIVDVERRLARACGIIDGMVDWSDRAETMSRQGADRGRPPAPMSQCFEVVTSWQERTRRKFRLKEHIRLAESFDPDWPPHLSDVASFSKWVKTTFEVYLDEEDALPGNSCTRVMERLTKEMFCNPQLIRDALGRGVGLDEVLWEKGSLRVCVVE